MSGFIPNVLSIAGSDPSGGAGIQADLKTFAALGCHGMAVVSALTAQNTVGVSAVHLPPPEFVHQQIDMIFADIEVSAVKIGMLGSAAIVKVVADSLRGRKHLPIVVDPVLVATSGAQLGDETVIEACWRDLFPLATLITPNLAEAERLSKTNIGSTRDEIEATAYKLQAQVPTAWLLKGGHSQSETADDLLLHRTATWFSSPRIKTKNTHGTGCTLSSAVAAYLARGDELPAAVANAKAYVDVAISHADGLSVGQGPGALDHFARWR